MSSGWQIMRAGSGGGAVLCLNFTVAGVRAQASFADLAPRLPDRYAVWGTDDSVWPTAPGDPAAQLAGWLDSGSVVDAPVRAVFGVCGTAALAAVLAHRLGGDPPAVVLFDPIVVGAKNLIDQAEDSLRQLGLDEAVPAADVTGEELAALATRLARRYAERAAPVAAARSIRPATMSQLYARLESYLRYLALCATAWSHPRVAPDLLVLSRHHEVPAALAGIPVVRLDATQDRLLGHPEAATAASRTLAGALVNGRS